MAESTEYEISARSSGCGFLNFDLPPVLSRRASASSESASDKGLPMFDLWYQLNDFTQGESEIPPVEDDASVAESSAIYDTHSVADTESLLSNEGNYEETPEPLGSDEGFEQYVLKHCKIRSKDLKPNALARLRDLRTLFAELQQKHIVRMVSSTNDTAPKAALVDSIFGFSRIFVDEIADFNDQVTRMVRSDPNCCWHANGRRTLAQPTSTVYELLRQVGIHPVKGTRGNASQDGCPSGTRDFMFYQQYAFDLERLQRNCSRLKIGVIGNRRS